METKEPFVIQKFKGFQILRDNLLEGGTKKRAFVRIIDSIRERELVYAANYYGNGGHAVALTALPVGKNVRLFFPHPRRDTEFFKKAVTLQNVTYEIVVGAKNPIEASDRAVEYAKPDALVWNVA